MTQQLDPRLMRRIQALNDVFGIDQKQIQAGLSPMDLASAAGRTVDSVTGAPTRAAIGAAITGGDASDAFGRQFGSNPDLAPDFGPVENMVLDPTNLMAMGGKNIPASLKALGEVGAIGERPEYIQRATQLMNRFAPGDKAGTAVGKALAMTEEKGAELPVYLDLRKNGYPNPVPNYSAAGSVLGPKDGPVNFFNEPLNWLDDKYQAARRVLENAKGPLEINTGSDLIAREGYIENIPTGSTINFHANTGDPGMPSAKRIANAIKHIKENRPDVKVSVKDFGYQTPDGNRFVEPIDPLLKGGLGNVPENFGQVIPEELQRREGPAFNLRKYRPWSEPQANAEVIETFGKGANPKKKAPPLLSREQLLRRLKILDGGGSEEL